jgi:TPR repeat protein
LIALFHDERLNMRKILGMALAVLLSAGAAGAQDFEAGWAAADRGDYAAALKEWRPLAEASDASAQFNLGIMYDNGLGVPQDDAEADKWYRLAADQGHATAQYNLGVMYHQGDGVQQDKAEAVRWYRLAADQGVADAQFNLGVMYRDGLGVTQDYVEATRWFLSAAKLGYVQGQIAISAAYSLGSKGVPQDIVAAHIWANIACAQGAEDGCRVRDMAEAKMTPADISEAQRRARVCMESEYKDCD